MKFKIGDRVRIVQCRCCPEVVGQIGIIKEALGYCDAQPSKTRPGRIIKAGNWYLISGIVVPPPFRGEHHEETLELIPPDKEQTIPWSECIWKPAEIRA
jgi:hypothetical protein